MSSKEINVHISLAGTTFPVGRLWCHNSKGRESASFEYHNDWLRQQERFALEPILQLTKGPFHTQANMNIFGSIGDSAPDRWGRLLMRRNETKKAKTENKTPRTLFEADYLLAVNDEARQGALRFSDPSSGEFLSPNNEMAIPPLIDLPRLLNASERFLDENESAQDLKLLLAPGSSIGGARPKASIRDNDGDLAIAKFPKKDDEYNIIVWEAIALTLAKKAKINVPSWRLEAILKKSVLILKRFDRNQHHRIPFLSAMSMLGALSHETHSYLEINYALEQNGAAPGTDMEELWRRIVFNVLISNTDDHLRNHGFLYERFKGWRLSPIYDINPTPIEIKPRILTTMIDFYDASASLELALSVREDFRISKERAILIIKEVAHAVSQWRNVAAGFGLARSEMDRMSSAFEHQDLINAKKM
jgi:serine/threonine-protein kinase HipA